MKQKVALVLSGGGARGIAHIGVIEVLEEHNFEISSVAGTSMGSLVGGIHAMGKLKELKKWLYTLDRRKVFQLVDFTFGDQGLIKGDRVLNTLQKFITDTNIENLAIPYSATAVDIINKKEVVFTRGSIFDAIRASIAIPSVLTPVKTNDGLLVDGGVLNNIPVTNVTRQKNDLLIAVDVNANIPVQKPKQEKGKEEERQKIYSNKLHQFYRYLVEINPLHSDEDQLGFFTVIDQTISLMMHHISQINLKSNPPDVLIKVSRDSANTFDFYRAEELVEIGRHAAEFYLKKNQL